MFAEPTRRTLIAAALLLCGLLTACSSAPSAPACPDDYPSTCPDGGATFAAQVEPLMQTRCVYCHASGQRQLLRNYTEIRAAAPAVIMQLMRCSMPPAPVQPLTTEERRVLLGWLACGALDN
jgi:uncharacterized membrane protein